MSDCYSKYPKHYVAVDCIIFGLNHGELSLLLAQRTIDPERGKWSLMVGL